MLIDVTPEHIKNGVPEDECNCPIALAVCNAVESELDDNNIEQCNIIAVVHDNDISVHFNHPDGMEYQYNISPKVKGDWNYIGEFISAFDNDGTVEPFEMEFEIN